MSHSARARPDAAARALELGLSLFIVLAPLPFGAVRGSGRLAFELGAFALLAVWTVRAALRPNRLPGALSLIGIAGLLGLALIQSVPVGAAVVRSLSPAAFEIHSDSRPQREVLAAEERLLGVDPRSLEPAPTLSVDPTATAAALRTGAALASIFLVACTVAATCGARGLAMALLVSASLQGLYGLLVLASDSPRIWHLPKQYYLNSATGTFINRNHFACLLAMSVGCGLALILHNAARTRRPRGRGRLLHLFAGDNSRNLVLGILLALALAGLLTSLSRAGIAVGLLAVFLTLVFAGRSQPRRPIALVGLLLLAIASVPLIQLGAGVLIDRFENTADELLSPGGRVTVWRGTLAMASAAPLIGHGYGTFAYAYPVYRAPEVRLFYAHAHNDLLQAVAEGGALGLVWVGLLLYAVLRNVVVGLSGRKGVLGVGFAAGLIAMLLHALVDFNFHIPANAGIAAALAGVLEGLPWKIRSSS